MLYLVHDLRAIVFHCVRCVEVGVGSDFRGYVTEAALDFIDVSTIFAQFGGSDVAQAMFLVYIMPNDLNSSTRRFASSGI